ncbi:MAG: hypothetical protein MJ195_01280 [Mycoplasmoidaceae bacterium]|nr:hypothetical protein [Mycoplasmoidaceae bacterium]
MKDLCMTQEQIADATLLYTNARLASRTATSDFSYYTNEIIVNDESGEFFEPGTYDSLNPIEKYNIMAKIHLV